jgi:hypothetical protein
MDFRGAGGASKPHARASRRFVGSPLSGLMFVGAIGGVAFAFIAAATADALLSASLLTTYAAANTMMMLLVDFTGIVVSPDDYGILGHRPVGSRTYFAARLAAVATYVAALSLVMALLPAVVYGVRLGPLAAAATLLAVLLGDLSVAVIVITAYVALLEWVHPARLRRAMSYFQLAAAMSFYGVYYLATTAFESTFFDRVGFDGAPWLWAIPSTWFAALIVAAGGTASPAVGAASAAAVLLSIACVPLAAGRLSLEYARQVGEVAAAGEPAARRRMRRLPGFGDGEGRAVALLVRAQFRYDQRFRMGILGILPLTAFYLLLGLDGGSLADPFDAAARHSSPRVFFAIVFIPITLHAALAASESWRAAWIFFATPASHARIVVATKNFVTMYFLGSYLVALTALWSVYFTRVWHAAVHAAFAGLLAHLLLQLTVIVKPALPFAAEPRKAERSATMFLVIFVGSIAAGTFPFLLPMIYRNAVTTVAALLLTLGLTAAVEYALRLRVNEAIGDLEFRN